MPKCTIYRNLCAGRETYFLRMGIPAHASKVESRVAGGYNLVNSGDKWALRKAEYYLNSLKDREYFPVVGSFDVDQLIIGEALKAIKSSE